MLDGYYVDTGDARQYELAAVAGGAAHGAVSMTIMALPWSECCPESAVVAHSGTLHATDV